MLQKWQWKLVLALLILALCVSITVFGLIMWNYFFTAVPVACVGCHAHYTNNTVMVVQNATAK
jgi:hypothetical protein